MNNLKITYTEEELDQIADTILANEKSLSEDDALQIIGDGLYDLGIMLEEEDRIGESTILKTSNIGESSLQHVMKRDASEASISKNRGRWFLKKLRNRVAKYICNNPTIKEWIADTGDAKKKAIKTIVLLIVSAIGLSINPVVTGIIVSAAILILKIGYEAYCEAYG